MDRRESSEDVATGLGEGLLPASRGTGPLLQRDYWGVIRGCRLRPSELMTLLARDFATFAPPALVRFHRPGDAGEPLRVGDEMDVEIRTAGTFRVRVVHRDATSITYATLPGHPEAGRITFGAYRNAHGDVIFHIRSRARSGSATHYVGFIAFGEPMQTTTWTDFIDRLAHSVGDGIHGAIHAETRELPGDAGDDDPLGPTFTARAD